MDNILIKLNAPETNYNFFEDNQVLTAQQLNNNVFYFDRQNRLTRTKLAGVGIVCGLSVSSDNTKITITKGCGVTTDGDLLQLPADSVYTKFISFSDAQAKYPAFFKDDASQIELLELLPDDTTEANAQPVSTLSSTITNKIALLYLDSYLHDEAICTGTNCDNKGLVQHDSLYILLANKTDIDVIIKNNTRTDRSFFDLPKIAMLRLQLAASINSVAGITAAFNNAIINSKSVLYDAFDKSFAGFQSILLAAFNNVNPVDGWKRKTDTIITAYQNQSTVQYVYDFIRDLFDAYSEWYDEAFDISSNCCPDPAGFPKHILLGEVNYAQTIPSIYRQPFSSSDVFKADVNDKLIFLFKRIEALIDGFNIPSGNNIKVTPSKSFGNTLSERSIPFYYDYKIVLPYWNFENSLRNKNETTLSYYGDQYSSLPQVVNPLKYYAGDYDFYRIEGLLGLTAASALNTIKAIRTVNNLSFKITAVQVEPNRLTIVPGLIKNFPELEVLHGMYSYQASANLQKVKSFNDKVNTVVTTTQVPNIDKDTSFINQKADAANTELSKNYLEFNYDNFRSSYDDANTLGLQVNDKVKNVTDTKVFTPYEQLEVQTQPDILKWITDIVNNRNDTAKDNLIFSNFYNLNTGMNHHAGVINGGTFVLIYESATNHIIADFYLPYAIEEPVSNPTPVPRPPVLQPLPWHADLLLDVDNKPIKIKTDLLAQIDLINKSYTDLGTRTTAVENNLTKNQNILVDTFQKSLTTLVSSPIYTKDLGGAVKGSTFTNSAFANIDTAISSAVDEKAALAAKTNPTDDDKARMNELDNIIADNTKAGASLLADKTSYTAEDTQFMGTLAKGITNVSDANKATISTELDKISTQKTGNTFIASNFNNLKNIGR